MSEETEVGLNWGIVLWYIHVQILGVFGLWMAFAYAKWMTIFFAIGLTSLACMGLTIGAHRLWAHCSFSASFPLRLMLVVGHTLAGVGPIHDWVLYHRMHHKFYGTEHDPYNHKKGLIHCFLLANMQLTNANSDMEHVVKAVDMRDIERDFLVALQKRFYWLFFIAGIALPVLIPMAYWDEWIVSSIMVTAPLRFVIAINVAWLINSAFIVWNVKENEKYPPTDTMAFFITRSRWPAYHYLLPWDYNSGEFGTYDRGLGATVLRLLHQVGLTSHLKTVSGDALKEVFLNAAGKDFNIQDVVYKLKNMSEYEAEKENLVFRG